ncbi:putative lipoprotein, partial [Vibrio cholerae HC-56A1]
MNGRK